MTTLSPGTHPDIGGVRTERPQLERLRHMPAWRKLERVGDLLARATQQATGKAPT